MPGRTVRVQSMFGVAIAAAGALGLSAQSCGVMSADDCTEKATCPEADGSFSGDSPDQGQDVGDAAGEGGGDEGVATEGGDIATQNDGSREDAASTDTGGDVALDTVIADASSEDAAQDMAIADASSEDVTPSDVVTPCDLTNPDCTNPVCAPSFTCIPAVPSGWTGPVALFDQTGAGSPAPAAPACPTMPQYSVEAYDGHANPVSQGACTCACGSASAVTCTGPTVQVFRDGVCGSSNACISVANVSACTSACASSSALSAKVTAAPAPSGGSCPSTVQNGLQPWNLTTDWATTGRVCAASRTVSQGGCAVNEVCADAPPSTFAQAVCVYQAGALTCPPGYPHQYVYFEHGTDSRSCTSGCGCGSPTGVTCTLSSVSVSATSASCSSPASVSTTLNQCSMNLAATARNVTASVTPSGGQCAPTGTATVAGMVTPDTPTTVCCTQ
jgi:hypothetical protein